MVYTTQIPKDPQTGAIVPGDIKVQTRRTLANLKQSMEAAGGSLQDIVSVLIFLVDSQDASAMNEVYAEFFSEPYPTRATVVVKELLGAGTRVEIQAQACLSA